MRDLSSGAMPGPVVPDLDEGHLAAGARGEAQRAAVFHGIEGVFDQGGPDLVELAAVGADGGQVGVEVALDGDVLEARVEHGQGGLERLGEIDVLNGRLVHVGVVLDGADQVEDADGGVDDGLGHALDAEGAGEGGEGDGQDFGGGVVGEVVELYRA